jgi:hypothetical protein
MKGRVCMGEGGGGARAVLMAAEALLLLLTRLLLILVLGAASGRVVLYAMRAQVCPRSREDTRHLMKRPSVSWMQSNCHVVASLEQV